MEPDAKILEKQQELKKNFIEKMESQNKRYKEALKFIEYLIGELESSKTQTKSLNTKSGTEKMPVEEPKPQQDSNKLNSFLGNTKIIKDLSNYYKGLSNVLKFEEAIKGKNYTKEITDFLDSEEEENHIILKIAIQKIQKFIKENFNPDIGIPLNDYYSDLLTAFDGIVTDVLKLEINLKRIEQITSKKLDKSQYFSRIDISKLIRNMNDLKETLDLSVIKNVKKQMFNIEGETVSIEQLLEKMEDIKEFSQLDNPLIEKREKRKKKNN